MRERWRRPRHVGRWLLGGFFLLSLISGLAEDDDEAPPPAPSQHVAPLPADPAVRLYLRNVQEVCRERDRKAARRPDLIPLNEILQFEVSTTSLVAGVPAPSDALEIRRVLIQSRRSVDRLTLRVYHALKDDPHPSTTLREKFAPQIRQTVRTMYTTFAGFGLDCDVA